MRVFLLFLVLFAARRVYGQSKPVSDVLAQNNFIVALNRLDGLDEVLDVEVENGHANLVSIDGSDAVGEYIAANPEAFRRELGFISFLYHGTGETYRQVATPSLHFVKAKDGTWSVHFDKWCPRLRRPATIVAHCLLEVIPHGVLGTKTSQIGIMKMLARYKPV